LVEDQFNVALPPLVTEVGPTLNTTVGEEVLTVTVTDWEAVPPGPVQDSAYIVVRVRPGVDAVPPRADFDPVHPPEAEQDVAFWAAQVSVAAAPRVMVLGFALKVTIGAAWRTLAVADCEAEPPAPVQVSTNVALAVSGPVETEPLTALAPLHAPEAEQEVALFADQVSVALLPVFTVLGLTLNLTTGGSAVTLTVVDCVTKPPGPRQVRSYSVELLRRPVDHVPLVATFPLQPPPAVHCVAFVDFHVSDASEPAPIVDGVATSVKVGVTAVTTISTDCDAAPPPPVQVSVSSVFAASGAVAALPLVGREPLQPPLAVHELAFVVLHSTSAAAPAGMLLWTALKTTVGCGS
jgi:hypothetical protein